jgi:hypothetical protein
MANRHAPDLRRRIIHQLRCDLTNGRSDEDLIPYTNAQIDEFIHVHAADIDRVIANMIAGLPEEDLVEPEADWIREFLYPVISYESLIE